MDGMGGRTVHRTVDAPQPEVTVILSGMSGIEQLRENVRALADAEPEHYAR
jgi:predicted aldo/keto reductase-like oxidoreductase